MKALRILVSLLTLACPAAFVSFGASIPSYDVCIYGGTAAGVAAAMQAARMGRTAVILEPGVHLGGLTSGGLGATDIGNKAAIGGIAREFYQRIARHYSHDSAWVFESRESYFKNRAQGRASNLEENGATMWTFEPHVAEDIFIALARENSIPVQFRERLQSVRKEGPRILEIKTDSGAAYRARMFIDASYEGDLMALAGVSFTVGREANTLYGESLNGIRAETPKHQFDVRVDPYRLPGHPESGLLPFIQAGDGGVPGEGDQRVQTYNFRLCFTTNAANRMPLLPPPGYDPGQYELLARYLEARIAAGHPARLEELWNPIWMPNGKTDINNNGPFSTDYIGANYEYPNGGLAARQRIWDAHESYTRGFLTFLATDPRVPEKIRAEMKLWGPCKDEFQSTGGWPHQLYIREARRMVSDYIMTEHNCRGLVKADDPAGLGAYNMDSHNCQRIVKNGQVENEGDVQVGVKPYPISFRSIVPKGSQCQNLLVPVCLSATHIAYGSIRMEPVFMILGQSAATAACLALENETSVQAVPYSLIRARLIADKQVLEWTAK